MLRTEPEPETKLGDLTCNAATKLWTGLDFDDSGIKPCSHGSRLQSGLDSMHVVVRLLLEPVRDPGQVEGEESRYVEDGQSGEKNQ